MNKDQSVSVPVYVPIHSVLKTQIKKGLSFHFHPQNKSFLVLFRLVGVFWVLCYSQKSGVTRNDACLTKGAGGGDKLGKKLSGG